MSSSSHAYGSNNKKETQEVLMDVEIQNYPRDPTYYFEDGSIILLVGGILFKIHLSLLAPDEKPRGYDRSSCIRSLLGNSRSSVNTTGTSDADAVLIPNINARQFRHFLLAVLGKPGNPTYMSLLTDAQDSNRRTQAAFIRYLDIGTMAELLRMTSLKAWAQSQLELFLNETLWASKSTWSQALLLQTAAFGAAPNTRFNYAMQTLLLSVLSHPATSNEHTQSPYHQICVSLYQTPRLSESNAALSGWVFLYVLSLGHRSPTWLNQLSRNDRLVLHTAYAELTSLRYNAALQTIWLTSPKDETFGAISSTLSCGKCLAYLQNSWNSSLGQVGLLNSAVPLEDIRRIMRLPSYREIFAKSVSSHSWPFDCGCFKNVLSHIDTQINELFQDFSQVQKQFVETA